MPENLQNDDIERVRRQPVMYFGSTGERGVEQFVYELVTNAIDSYLANQASFVKVELDGVQLFQLRMMGKDSLLMNLAM